MRVVLFILYIIGYSFYLRWMYRETGVWGIEFGGVTLFLGLAVAFLISRSNAKAAGTLMRLSPRPGPGEDDLKEHRKQIVWSLLGTAALCDRAAVESLASQGKIAETQRGVGRQRALAVARIEPVWAWLSDKERDLLIADEGSWIWNDIWPWIVRGEDVRVMRWAIGMDEVLRPFEFLKPDLSPVFRTTAHAEETNGERCLAAYDLRPAQTMAEAMVARCAAEGVLRGDWQEDDAAAKAEMVSYAERMGADESGDLLIGSRTVAKAEVEKLRWVAQAAVRRMKVLEGLIAYLNGPADGKLRIEGVPGPRE